jgi:DNA-binding response OmpR family regulator
MTTKRLLIVDDEAAMRRALSRELALAGFETVAVESGHAALAATITEPFDAVVLDVIMPGMDGFEVCRRLKADPRTAGIPVIFFSTSSSGEFRRRAFALGAADFLVKPFQTNSLPAFIRALLQRDERAVSPAGRVISVIGAGRLSGAAAEAVRLAEAAVLHEAAPIMLIDLEFPSGNMGARLQLAGGPNVHLLLQDTGEPVSVEAIDRVARRFHHALQVIPAPYSPSSIGQAELLPRRLADLLDILTARGYHTILHLGTSVDELNLTALARSETVWVATKKEDALAYEALRAAMIAGGMAGHRIFMVGGASKENHAPAHQAAAPDFARAQGQLVFAAGQLAVLA